MNCPACGFENPEGIKFCGNCAQPLLAPTTCPSCGFENPPGFKFCGECAAPLSTEGRPGASSRDPRDYTPRHLADRILTSRSALEGERKQVTVLFADVKGSMELAEQVDPEEWHSILDRFFQILADGVHRFEGTVNQYTGDGIMALFGAPIAHEDHAQRACYASLHLQDALRTYAEELKRTKGLNFSVRTGLNSGEVVVGRIGDDLRMDYTAQGQTVGLAERLQQLADPGMAYLADPTARLVEGFFRLRDLGDFDLKGITDPVRVYELEAAGPVRTRLDLARLRGFTRFVGRAAEMQTLELALHRATEGNGQVVGVVGEAGVGKSRLCLEFVERCQARGISVCEAHCPSHGKAVPFLPLLELLRDILGLSEGEPDQVAREKIAGRLLLLDREFEEILPLVFDFLGVPDPGHPAPNMEVEARQRQLHAFVKQLVQARSRREPAILLLDDLHWIDAASDAFLAQIVEAVSGGRTLLLVNFRPEYHADWVRRADYQQLPLRPLGAEAIAEMLSNLLGDDPSVAGLQDLIRERTGGNPFFIEEVVQSLAESGSLEGAAGQYRLLTPMAQLEVPGTVQTVLAARIDRLDEREKEVLQTAAVIGREFSGPILTAVVELPEAELAVALAVLKEAELIREEALFPDMEYAFKHPLTHEVAYGSQLRDRRQRVHGAVAQAIEAANPENLDGLAADLAHHWGEAGEALPAARWHSRAAEWVGTRDFGEALRHWLRVRALVTETPESGETMALGLKACREILNIGWRLGGVQDAESIFADGKTLAQRSGDRRSLAILFNLYGNVKGAPGDEQTYFEHAVEAVRLAEEVDDPGTRFALHADLCIAAWHAGRVPEMQRLIDEGPSPLGEDLDLGTDVLGYPPHMGWYCARALLMIETGRLEEAARTFDQLLQLCAGGEYLEVEAFTLPYMGYLAYLSGEAGGGLTQTRRTLELAERVGGPLHQIWALAFLGLAHLCNGDRDAAVEAEERALALARESRTGFAVPCMALRYLAEAHLGRADFGAARQRAGEALSRARQMENPIIEIDALLTRARVLLSSEGPAAASEINRVLARASDLVNETGARSRQPFVHELSAGLAQLLDDSAARDQELREAHCLYTAMGATGHAERLARELGL